MLTFLKYIEIHIFLYLIFFGINIYAVDDPVEFVNLRAGSFTNGRSFSTGNTLPLIGMPWGFNHWAPQTQRQDQRGKYY